MHETLRAAAYVPVQFNTSTHSCCTAVHLIVAFMALLQLTRRRSRSAGSRNITRASETPAAMRYK